MSTSRVLWVEGSPKGDRSTSSDCARAFLEVLAARCADVAFSHLDVWDADLPEFGRDAAIAKFAPLFGEELTCDEQAAWDRVREHIELVASHDVLLLSCPMWNWNVPYRVKQWLDVIVQPMLTFTVDRTGRHVGVLGVGKRAQLILTRSSAYDGRSPEMIDYQRPYLEYVLGDMLGYRLAPSVVIEPTTSFDPVKRAAKRDRAIASAAEAAEQFAEQFAEQVAEVGAESVPGALGAKTDE